MQIRFGRNESGGSDNRVDFHAALRILARRFVHRSASVEVRQPYVAPLDESSP